MIKYIEHASFFFAMTVVYLDFFIAFKKLVM